MAKNIWKYCSACTSRYTLEKDEDLPCPICSASKADRKAAKDFKDFTLKRNNFIGLRKKTFLSGEEKNAKDK